MNPLASQHATPAPTTSSSSAAAALRGASLAFQKKPAAAPPPPRDNGALTAATSVGRSRSPAKQQHLGPQMTGESDAEIAARLQGVGQLHPGVGVGVTTAAGGAKVVDPKSPSFIAATLAASRSASPSPKARTPLRRESADAMSLGSTGEVVDSGSIAPTGSLISMFEQVRAGGGGAGGDPVKRASPVRSPMRLSDESLDYGRVSLAKPKLKPKPMPMSPPPPLHGLSMETVQASPPRLKHKPRPISPPPQHLLGRPKTQAPSQKPKQTRPISPPLQIINKPAPQGLSPALKQTRRPISPPPLQMTNKPTPQPPSPRLKQKRRPISPPPLQVMSKPTPQPPSPMLKQTRRPISPPPQIVRRSTPQVLSPKPKRLSKPQLRPVTPPQIITRAATQEFSTPPPVQARESPKAKRGAPTPPKPRGSAKPALITAASDHGPVVKPKVSRPQIRQQQKPTPPPRRSASLGSVSSNDTFVSASSAPSPERASPPQLSRNRQPTLSLPPSPTKEIAKRTLSKPTATSVPPPPKPRRQRPTNSSTASLPLDSLTNAIMASSLASARLTPHNTGTSLAAPALPKRQKSPRLMQTMRQPAKISDEESSDRHKKGHLSKLHSGKHAHHEGSRRKWREEITPRERKRYEAVWASNRGVLLDYHGQHGQHGQRDQHDPLRATPPPPPPPAAAAGHRGDMTMSGSATSGSAAATPTPAPGPGGFREEVVNVVVREIWKRSRLPTDELTEVWDLVDRKGLGMLGRTEFVVGMWLIDQRLRGRKIPAKVSDSVWGSANGMKVMKPRIR